MLDGHSWQIRYGDGSAANGQVYLDKVSVGDLTFPKQAIEAAAKVSTTFSNDPAIDGLLGLAFSKINTIKPTKQNTWFENIKPKLAAPVFTSTLKREAIGAYDFGYLDKAKYKGEITWIDVKGRGGFWDFEATGFQVGSGPMRSAKWSSIADTGYATLSHPARFSKVSTKQFIRSSLWYAPKAIVEEYYSAVGIKPPLPANGVITFPCNTKLPDLTLILGGKKITVPGINMNYQKVGSANQPKCVGGLAVSSPNMPMNIAGDVFLKNLFVAFEHPVRGQPRLGFAQT